MSNFIINQSTNTNSNICTLNNNDNNYFIYRITGKQSIERLEPLIHSLFKNNQCSKENQLIPISYEKYTQITNCYSLDNQHNKIDFVWETTCEKVNKTLHQSAQILNKLNNSSIIESKSYLAFLQLLIPTHNMLETYVAMNAIEVANWISNRWNNNKLYVDNKEQTDRIVEMDWWVVKASKGNGGRDVWILNKQNYSSIIPQLCNDEYVIQRYVNNPLLLNGKKFHFRCYSVMTSTYAMIYQKSFVLTAGINFDYSDDDIRKHVTNLSINKRFEGHPGQVPCDLLLEFPHLFRKIRSLWEAVVTAASPYMRYQPNLNFEFFGIDVIADTSDNCWLIEANRLPGLESSNNNKVEEDVMYDEMMLSLLEIILHPILKQNVIVENDDKVSSKSLWHKSLIETVKDDQQNQHDDTWINTLKWRAFTKKHRDSIHVSLLK